MEYVLLEDPLKAVLNVPAREKTTNQPKSR